MRCGEVCGTCFTLEVERKQYLVTAKHVIKSLLEHEMHQQEVFLFRGKKWIPLPVTLVGASPEPCDVAVLAAYQQISLLHPLPAGSAGMVLSQDVFFLGFPFGFSTVVNELNGGFPIPFVKKAICSTLNTKEEHFFYLDGHNNPGFSGGPVVFNRPGEKENRIAAVVSGYHARLNSLESNEEAHPLFYRENTGIIIAYEIGVALKIINRNPIGFKVS